MKKMMLTVTAATVAATCLAWAQPPGAKDTVVIKEEAAAKQVKKETLQAPGAAPKPRVTRDPFQENPGAAAAAPPPVQQQVKPNNADNNGSKPGGSNAAAVKPPEKPIDPPKVTVKGIVSSGSGNRAIVVSPNNTFLVKSGDKLGDYRVSHIDRKQVVFAYKGKKFPIKLEDEFGGGQK